MILFSRCQKHFGEIFLTREIGIWWILSYTICRKMTENFQYNINRVMKILKWHEKISLTLTARLSYVEIIITQPLVYKRLYGASIFAADQARSLTVPVSAWGLHQLSAKHSGYDCCFNGLYSIFFLLPHKLLQKDTSILVLKQYIESITR